MSISEAQIKKLNKNIAEREAYMRQYIDKRNRKGTILITLPAREASAKLDEALAKNIKE